jgi:hypothetical protein
LRRVCPKHSAAEPEAISDFKFFRNLWWSTASRFVSLSAKVCHGCNHNGNFSRLGNMSNGQVPGKKSETKSVKKISYVSRLTQKQCLPDLIEFDYYRMFKGSQSDTIHCAEDNTQRKPFSGLEKPVRFVKQTLKQHLWLLILVGMKWRGLFRTKQGMISFAK